MRIRVILFLILACSGSLWASDECETRVQKSALSADVSLSPKTWQDFLDEHLHEFRQVLNLSHGTTVEDVRRALETPHFEVNLHGYLRARLMKPPSFEDVTVFELVNQPVPSAFRALKLDLVVNRTSAGAHYHPWVEARSLGVDFSYYDQSRTIDPLLEPHRSFMHDYEDKLQNGQRRPFFIVFPIAGIPSVTFESSRPSLISRAIHRLTGLEDALVKSLDHSAFDEREAAFIPRRRVSREGVVEFVSPQGYRARFEAVKSFAPGRPSWLMRHFRSEEAAQGLRLSSQFLGLEPELEPYIPRRYRHTPLEVQLLRSRDLAD